MSAIAHRWTGNRLPWRIAELLLPPLAALGRAHEALRFGDSVLSAIRVPLVYGAACIVAALAILRRRSIAN